MPSTNVVLRDVPVCPGFEIIECTIAPRDYEVRVSYTIKANEKLVALFKKSVRKAEAYANYNQWHDSSRCLIVLVSCRDEETPAQAAALFTSTVVRIMQAELEARAARSEASEVSGVASKSYRGKPPAPVRQQHRQPGKQFQLR